MKIYLEKLIEGSDLSYEEMKGVTEYCINKATDSEIAALLTALQAKGETADEIAGIVDVIRAKSTFKASPILDVIDNCGTGGDKSFSFNISTTSAFVLAGAGVTVAKHGNRSVTSKSGSADVLEALGVSITLSNEQIEELLHENKIAFLFAPNVHPSLKPFTKVRRDLGIRTVFNVIGPLVNPVDLDTQFLGVYDKSLLPMLAETLKKLGRRRAMVINGAGGLDEATLAGENHIVFLHEGNVTTYTLRPEDVGLPYYAIEEIRGGDAKRNAEILLQVLNGKIGPHYYTVLLNAGLALFTSGKAESIRDGIRLAEESIQSGEALKRLEKLVEYSTNLSGVV